MDQALIGPISSSSDVSLAGVAAPADRGDRSARPEARIVRIVARNLVLRLS